MDIYITKNDENIGPFSIDEVREKLSVGEVSAEDFAWHDGLEEWLPLSEILAQDAPSSGAELPPGAPPPPRSSKLRGPGSTPKPLSGSGGLGKGATVVSGFGSSTAPEDPNLEVKVRPGTTEDSSRKADIALASGTTSAIDGEVASLYRVDEKAIESLRTPDVIVHEGGKESGAVPGAAAGSHTPRSIHKRRKPAKEHKIASFRFMGVLVFVGVLYSYFVPWVRVAYPDGEALSRANALELAVAEDGDTASLGIEQPSGVPHFGRLFFGLGLMSAAWVTFLCVRFASNPPGVMSFAALLAALVLGGLLAGTGYVYGIHMENQVTAEALAGNVISMDAGFYLALACAGLALALFLLPDFSSMQRLPQLLVPAFIVLCGVGYLAVSALKYVDGGFPSPDEVIESARSMIDTISG